MTFRSRLTLVSMAGVAVAVVLASAVIWFVARDQLRGQVDDALKARVRAVSYRILPGVGIQIHLPPDPLGGAGGFAQIADAGGRVSAQAGAPVRLSVSLRTRLVAAGEAAAFFRDASVGGRHVRILTARVGPDLAVQLARPLDEVDKTLDQLGLILVGVSLGGIALAAALGALVARTAMAPIRRLTETTELVTSTTDLTRRIRIEGDDELSRLATSFNGMLESLEESMRTQRQLVADASHELRTPLTSVRTNIEVLARGANLPEEERRRIFQDVVAQLEELTVLVRDLVELARGAEQQEEPVAMRLDEVVRQSVARMQRYSHKVNFALAAEPCAIRGVPSRVDRAVTNLLDNAAKWSPTAATVDVRVGRGEISVRDHGPGIADEDLPFIFDRFYRSASARGLPGSGLGLAIVRQVAEWHGGDVTVERPPGGGSLFRLRLAAVPVPQSRVPA